MYPFRQEHLFFLMIMKISNKLKLLLHKLFNIMALHFLELKLEILKINSIN